MHLGKIYDLHSLPAIKFFSLFMQLFNQILIPRFSELTKKNRLLQLCLTLTVPPDKYLVLGFLLVRPSKKCNQTNNHRIFSLKAEVSRFSHWLSAARRINTSEEVFPGGRPMFNNEFFSEPFIGFGLGSTYPPLEKCPNISRKNSA